ncbi:MAG: TonB C-terminal domain-containing protein [Candidatus Obscuribacterales bacterium]|nr:TonB C-terminal domain-containing protein [Candidatus Obscuribacterales bacterium]
MRNTLTASKLLILLSVTLASAGLPALAQERIFQTAPATFAISAVKEERPRAVAARPSAFQGPSPIPGQAVPPEPFQARKSTRTGEVAYAPPTAAGATKSGNLEDYSVNWSPWMRVLADRWFGNLQCAEHASGYRFHTLRPAMIQFTCYADGQIGNVALKQSSGIAYYDRLQMATLLASAPLPPFPPGTERKSLTLVQGWESHRKEAGEREFEPTAFAARFPQEKVSRWVASERQ